MRIEYHTRDNRGKYKKEQDITSIYIQEDTEDISYLIIEKSDGSKKRYLLDAI